MKALIYQGPGQREWVDKEIPTIQEPTDVIVRMIKTTICGSDLHILKGDVPTVESGRTLGHEGIGIVEEVGSAVNNFKKGDKVLISCITSCGRCDYCRESMYSHCDNGGWLLGHLIDGTQAEYVRIPYADTSMYHVPQHVDEEALVMLSDILPTGFEVGVLKGNVKLGDTIAIVGAGPIGMSILLGAQFFSPARIIMVDLDDYRLETAKSMGATDLVNSSTGNAVEKIMELTEGKGVNVAIEAVGIPETFDLCQQIVAAGGHIANVGVHGKSVDLQLQKLWIHNITLTTGLVDTFSTPTLLRIIGTGKIKPEKLVTHRFKMSEMMKAYDVFSNAAKERSIKVIIDQD